MHKWKERLRPVRLEKRLEFDSYESTRDFLDQLGELCEKLDRFPDISFGKTYVNMTLFPVSGEKESELSQIDHTFASQIDELSS